MMQFIRGAFCGVFVLLAIAVFVSRDAELWLVGVVTTIGAAYMLVSGWRFAHLRDPDDNGG